MDVADKAAGSEHFDMTVFRLARPIGRQMAREAFARQLSPFPDQDFRAQKP